jgi:hypothetical protein
MKKVNNRYIDSMIKKMLNETLEERADDLVTRLKTNVNELGGMDDGHPKYGKKNFSKMTPEEIEDLMNDYPGLSQSEAKKLISLLGNESIDESSLNEDNLQQDIEDFRDSVETDNYQRSKDNDPDYEVAEPSVEFFLDLYPKYKGKEREIQQILNSPLTQNIKNSISDKGDVKNQIRDLKAKYIAGDSSVLPQLKALQSKLR